VARARATAASISYQRSAADLQIALRSDYAAIVGPERAEPFVAGVLERLRPILKPDDLVRTAVGRGTALPRPIRAIARETARLLLEASPARRPTWDVVVVDEYQRIPPAALGLLGLRSRRMLLSGDPRQGFGSAPLVIDATRGDPNRVHLEVSLRLPSAIATWIDAFWAQRDLTQPRIRTVVEGGEVSVHRTLDAARAAAGHDAQVIALETDGAVVPGSRTPFEALGLEWRSVILVDPDAILSRMGEPGLFVAATRAIDRLAVVQGGPA
jgi:superfamily I DNA/RNA helicase